MTNRTFYLMICIFFLILSTNISAQDSLTIGNFAPPKITPTIKAIETKEKISVDGKLNELSWKNAPITSNFFAMEPRQGAKVNYRTEVKVMYDDKNLYFGVFCEDSLGKKGVRVQDLRRDFVYGENDDFLYNSIRKI